MFKPNLVQKCSRIKVYNHWLIPFYYVEAKFGSLEKKDKTRLASIDMKFFRRTAEYALFGHKRNEEIFEDLKAEPVDQKLRRYKSN